MTGRAPAATRCFRSASTRVAYLSSSTRCCGARWAEYDDEEAGYHQRREDNGHLLTATAINFLRLGRWFAVLPRAKTRRTPFVRLMQSTRVA
jgi:hypothetical protein